MSGGLEGGRHRATRGISGIVAMVFMSLILLFFFTGVYYVTGVYSRVQQAQHARMLEVSRVSELVSSVRGEWWYNASTNLLVVSLSNYYSEAVSIPGLVVIMPDGSFFKVALNATLSPGESRGFSFILTGQPATVVAGVVSGERLSAKVSLPQRAVEFVAPPFPPGAIHYWERAELSSIYPSPTLTWLGDAEVQREAERIGMPSTIIVERGSLESGGAGDLAFLDGSAVSIRSADESAIHRVNSTLIVFDGFETNPLVDGRLVGVSGSWSWTAGIVRETSTASAPPSDEHIAYINIQAYNVTSLPQELYVVTLLMPENNRDYHGAVFMTGPSNSEPFVELTINPRSDTVSIRSFDGDDWHRLCSSGGYNFRTNVWYAVMARFSRTSQAHSNFSILAMDEQGGPLLSCSATADLGPAYIGLANYLYARTRFDTIYVSNATDPRYVYMLNSPQEYDVVIETESATFTGYYDSSIEGHKVPLFPNPQRLELVLENASLRVYSGNALVAEYTGTVKGGDYYYLSVGGALLVVEGTLDTSGLRHASEVIATLSVASNRTSTLISVYLYDWTLDSYSLIAQGTGSILANVSLADWTLDEAFSPNGTFRIKVEALDGAPFAIASDALNLMVRGFAAAVTTVLLVGYEQSIDVYEIRPTGSIPSLTYLYTVTTMPPVTLGVDADFTYSSGYLYVAHGGSGIYRTPISPTPSWERVNTECKGSAGRMLILENVDYAGSPALLFAQGRSYCVVDGASGTTIVRGSLPTGLGVENPYNNYLASARSGSTVYVSGINTTNSAPILLEYSADTNTWRAFGQLSVTKVVGMAYSPDVLWIAAENGPLYGINAATGDLMAYSITMPFSPLGPGDRMEYISSIQSILFVRGDDTSEVWIVRAVS